MTAVESLMEGLRRDTFPSDEWFNPKFPRKFLEIMRLISRAYRISPRHIWDMEYVLGADSEIGLHVLHYLLLAMAKSASEVVAQEEAEDGGEAVLAPDDPLSDFVVPAREVSGRTPQRLAPPGRVAYVPSAAARLVYRSLQSEIDADARLALQSAACNGTTSAAGPSAVTVEAEHLRSATEPRRLLVNTGHDPAFEGRRAALEGALRNHRERSEQPAEIQPAGDAPGSTTQSGEQQLTVNNIPDSGAGPSQSSGTHEARPSVNEGEVQTDTPRLRPVRTTSSPNLRSLAVQAAPTHVTTTSNLTPEGRPMNDQELSKLQDSQKKSIMAQKITFGIKDYLEDFIRRLEMPLRRARHVPSDEQAECIPSMLSHEVKARCAGNSALLQPKSPDQIYQMLRVEFPARDDHLLIDLQDQQMADTETAVDFMQRAQQIFVRHQVTLPATHDKCMMVYMRGSQSFVRHVADDFKQRMLMARQVGQNPTAVRFGWAELQALARDFDAERALFKGLKSRGREMKSLAKDANPHYPPQPSKLRSGRQEAHVSAIDTPRTDASRSPSRGRQSERDPSEYRHRSPSASGYASDKSRVSDRSRYQSPRSSFNEPKSPTKDNAGRTPAYHRNHNRAPFQRPPFAKSNSGASQGANINAQLVFLNWVHVNMVRSIPVSEEVADEDPIVISTLSPAGATPLSAPVMAASNRRPVRPEGLTHEELDMDNTPINLPEAMRRGLQHVQSLPVNNPYTKLLNAQFMMSFKQVAGLCQDEEFSTICKNLLELSLRRDSRQNLIASTRAAVDILQMACAELPVQHLALDRTPVSIPDRPMQMSTVNAHRTLVMSLAHMTGLKGTVDAAGHVSRLFRLDSGAAVSSMSREAFDRDAKHILPRANLVKLLTPMTLTGFASGHMKVSTALEGVRFTIGNSRCTHNFLIVPGLTCDYLLGQDFHLAYDLQVQLVDGTATMGVVEEEWTGTPETYQPFQVIDARLLSEQVDLTVRSS